jgi:DNA-binding winged helix-turn-helix (wHTH) protein
VIFLFDEYELDSQRLQLRRSGKLLKLDSSALRLLAVLVRQPGTLITKHTLTAEVWEGRALADNAITVAMARLRKALVPGRGGADFIATVYGEGYRFVRPVSVRDPLEVGREAVPTTPELQPQGEPYVGRARVLARLHEALNAARAGRGSVCVLMGEPGIGKTRAVEVLERELRGSGVRVAWGYCREAGETPPLWPWRELLDQMTGSQDASAEVQQSSSAVQFSEALQHSSAKHGPETGSGDTVRYSAFERLVGTFTLAAKQGPWLLVLDDLHRADAASLELLSHLVDRVARTHILLVATLRPEGQGGAGRAETPLPRILGHRNCERIALERLPASEVAHYVAAYVDDPEGKLARAIHEKSEGNPFFMAELLRQLRDASVLSPDALAVPDAALDLVRQRVAQIDLNAHGLLRTCAVIGRSFELSLLSDVTGREASLLMADLEAALGAEMVVTAPHSSTAFAFSHDLIRAVLYDASSPAERRALHLAVGEALARRRPHDSSVSASDLAYHLYAALPLGDLRVTVRVCREAAAAAAAVFGSPDVSRYARYALEALLLMERPSVRLHMSLLYMTAIYTRAFDPSFARYVEQLLLLAQEHQDAEMLTRGAALLDAHFCVPPIGRGAAGYLEQALRLLPAQASGLRAVALAGLAAAAPHCYVAERCETLVEQAAQLAREVGSQGGRYVALLHQLHLIGGPLQRARTEALATELELMVQQKPAQLAGLPIDLALFRASQAYTAGALDKARTGLTLAASRARQLHHAELSWHCERALVLLGLELGEGPQAWDALAALHERAQRAGIAGSTLLCAYDRLVLLPEVEESPPALDQGQRAALQFDADDAPMFRALKLRALACAGFHDEARAALRSLAPEALTALPLDSQYLGTLGHLTRAALLLDESAYYAPLSALLGRFPDALAVQLLCACDGPVPQLLGELAYASGQLSEATAQFENALAASKRAGLVVRAAQASLWLVRCLTEQTVPEHIPRAVTLARNVRNNSARMGMLQLGRKASALLRLLEGD